MLAAVIGCSLLASACAGSSPSASVARLGTTTTSRSPGGPSTNNGNGSPLAYARCMRAHGVPDFPDPGSQGGFTLQGGQEGDLGPDSPVFQQANEDCQKFTPTSGIGHVPSPAQIAQLQASALKFSQCMRSHGIADFPDPVFHSSGGGISVSIKGGPGSDLTPNSPTFQAAQQACQKILPGPKGGTRVISKGPGGGVSSGAASNANQRSGG
ncbi:MAG: hypothetical protein ABSA91_11925 [Acidimicrobiales bacterium]